MSEESVGVETQQEGPDPAPTAPTDYMISLRGFESEEKAHEFANLLRICITEFSRYIDLESLDGITVAYDYKEALAGLDRGLDGTRPLKPTEESYGIGVAMTPTVIRDGVVKSHIVFNAGIIRMLEDPTHEYRKDTFYLLAHECGHVHDQKYRDRAFPGVLLQKKLDTYEQDIFHQIVSACWDEYAACRLSAAYATSGVISGHEETLLHRIENVRAEANEATKAYRMHGDVQQLLVEAVGRYGELLKFAAYFLGDLHGRGEVLSVAPRVVEMITGHWFESHFNALSQALDGLYGRYGEWKDLSEFDAIANVARAMLVERGLVLSTQESGELYVDVPFSEETLPDDEWVAQWLEKKDAEPEAGGG